MGDSRRGTKAKFWRKSCTGTVLCQEIFEEGLNERRKRHRLLNTHGRKAISLNNP